MKRKNVSVDENAWYVFVGCALLGLGIGMATGSAGSGLVIGAGVGFLAMVAIPYLNN